MSRPRTRPLPSVAELERLYDYNPSTGDISFKPRFGADGFTQSWNRRYAGKVAGCVMNVGYLFIRVRDQTLLGHRVAWALHHGAWPEGEIDHRDRDKLNNAIANLRLSTRTQNITNRPGTAVSGFKGVCANKGTPDRFGASIRVNGKRLWLGTYGSPEEAHAAYCGAARTYHRAFAHTGLKYVGTICATVRITAVAA